MDASHVSFEITLIGEILVAESTMVGGGALVGKEVLHHGAWNPLPTFAAGGTILAEKIICDGTA